MFELAALTIALIIANTPIALIGFSLRSEKKKDLVQDIVFHIVTKLTQSPARSLLAAHINILRTSSV